MTTARRDAVETINYWAAQFFTSSRSGKRRVRIIAFGDAGDGSGGISTSVLAKIDGDVVTTASGSVYRLGEPAWPQQMAGRTLAELCEAEGVVMVQP